MKQVPADKYNIAWFKLAECVARKEKERAMGVYRLLTHSLDDTALACQLKGDLLLSFEEDGAQNFYQEAAWLYQNAGRYLEAAAVYEHLRTIEPENQSYCIPLIDLYQKLELYKKKDAVLNYLVDSLIMKQAEEEALTSIKKALDCFTAFVDKTVLQDFLSTLELSKSDYFDKACQHLES